MLEDDVNLHRLIWSPNDIQDGVLKKSAFPKNDLDGTPDQNGDVRYLSVSRIDLLCEKSELETAERQAGKAITGIVRDEAWSAILNSGELRACVDTEGVNPFDVTSEPIPGENEAHCGIRNASKKYRPPSYINQLRVLLVEVAQREVRRLNELLESIKN